MIVFSAFWGRYYLNDENQQLCYYMRSFTAVVFMMGSFFTALWSFYCHMNDDDQLGGVAVIVVSEIQHCYIFYNWFFSFSTSDPLFYE